MLSSLFEKLLLTSDSVFLVVQLDGVCIYVSPTAEATFGVQPAEVVGRSVLTCDCVHPDDRAKFAEAFAAVSGGRPCASQLILRDVRYRSATTRTWYWVEVKLSTDGEFMYMEARDEKSERRVEELLRAFLMTTSHDLRTPCHGMQTAAELLRARTSVAEDAEATELLGVCSASCAQMLGTIENVLTKSPLGAADSGAGSTLARATAAPAHEVPFGLTTLELTGRLYQNMLATTNVIFHCGEFLEDGGIALRYMSPNVQRVTGHPGMGHSSVHPFFKMLHPSEVAFASDAFAEARARQLATGNPAALVRLSIYRRFRLPDHSYIPMLSTGCVDADHFYMMCQGLASQTEREDAMRCRLGATIRELREPATSMLAAASLLMARPSIQSDSEAKFLLNAMHAACSLLLGIVGNVASLQSIEAGDTQMNVAPFDPHGAINDVLSVCRLGCAGGDKAVWTDEGVPLPPLVEADKTFLSACVQNILVNALKFQEGRGVTLSATFQPDEANADGGMLLVSVADKGCGMSAEQAERCFLAFEAASAQKGGGTGLGLFIGRTLARRAGGDLTVNTALGQGSTFTLRLPVRIVRDSPAPMLAELPTPLKQNAYKRRSSSSNNGTTGSADINTLTCILADDHVLNLCLMRRLLEQSGFAVTTAASGDEAFEKMQAMADRLDIAIIDFQMPVSGPDCVRMWRAWEREQGRLLRLPVVCLTANVLEEERRECQLAGFDSFLNKPLRADAVEELRARGEAYAAANVADTGRGGCMSASEEAKKREKKGLF